MKPNKQNLLYAASLLLALGVDAAWRVSLPPNTSINLPIQSIEVRDIRLPLPGGSTTDTIIEVGTERAININTNGVTGTVQVIASLQVAVSRASIEAITGLPTGQATHSANTNAVAQIAFSKVMQTLPIIAAELSK